ncbi:MAG: hypothetical protein MJ105_03220 [Lachnospiraceae bacterium]|nr:hypothetical protein [Lachnospiraceae bacterium]
MTKWIMRIAYVYVALPFIIFAIGFMRWYIGIPAAGVAIFGLVRMWMSAEECILPKKTKKNVTKLVLAVLFIGVWVYLSGIGKFVWQNQDHEYRNTIFEMLVSHKWPVINGNGRGMSYYIGFWLPAAVFGKVFGISAGFVFQALWAVLGIFLTYYFICDRMHKFTLWPLLIVILFSGLDMAGVQILARIQGYQGAVVDAAGQIEWWAGIYQYSSMTTQLFWVFNQAVPAWLVLMLLLKQKTNKYVLVLMGELLLCSALPFMGMVPILLYVVFFRKYEGNKKAIQWRNDTLTLENLLVGGVTGILTFLYYFGNDASKQSQNVESMGGVVASELLVGIGLLSVLFILLEMLVYAGLVFRFQKKNILFYVCVLWLCICPFIRIGYSYDFCMRASIPCLFVLMLYVIDALKESKKKKKYITLALLIICLGIGAITPIHEFTRTVQATMEEASGVREKETRSVEEEIVFHAPNFSMDTKQSIFFNYIGKK